MKKSQVSRIKEKLLDGQWHCTNEFYADFMADPRRRMVDLKEQGYELESRICKTHNHDGSSKEWKLKAAPAKRYPFNVYIGAQVFEVQNAEEEARWRAYADKVKEESRRNLQPVHS